MRDQRDRHLLDDLHAFLQEHRRCGDMDSAVEGDRVWMTCTCGDGDQPLGRRRVTWLRVRRRRSGVRNVTPLNTESADERLPVYAAR